MDAFYASVEQRDDPRLRGRPVLVGGDARRGVVTSASYEARPFGVRSAMPMAEALARCPHAIVVRGRMDRYVAVGRELRAIFHRFTPLVEPLSLDEAFLDVSASVALFGPAPEIARQLRTAIRAGTALTASAGVAPNKFVAKIASDVSKPDGLLVVAPEDVRSFLAPLPVRHVWGVGRVTEAALLRLGLRTIGDLAAAEPRLLARHFRGGASELVALARGIDNRPVRPDRAAKSIGEEETFARDLAPAEVEPHLLSQAENVARRLRAHGLRARTVALKVKIAARWRAGRFPTLTRRHTVVEPTADEAVLFAVARTMLEQADLGGRRVRLVGLAAANLVPAAPEQVPLFTAVRESAARQAAVARAVDELAQRFGADVVRRRLPESPVRK
ncbi:MAG: DNA polymerase IV [Deltaproteobacteria bacterium]|nr:MAG: DNA polymerase IV [Deltaproteobacteria bacterium]